MERYESTCARCGHQWQYTGFKTGVGKTAAQLADMARQGSVCPECDGPATKGLAGLPPPRRPRPTPVVVTNAPDNSHRPVLEVLHSSMARASPDSDYKSKCLRCTTGVLSMRVKMGPPPNIWDNDTCLVCGQRYLYLDGPTGNRR